MDIFINNLKHLAKIYSQHDIAEKTGFSSGSIANYINGKSLPSAQFLLELKKAYKIDIDQFLTTNLEENNFNISKDVSYKKYFGTYIVYYYNSSAYKGKVGSYNYDILTFKLFHHLMVMLKKFQNFMLNFQNTIGEVWTKIPNKFSFH